MGLQVTTCEHEDKWLEVARERFKDVPNVRVLKYENEGPATVDGLGDDERFDAGFVDSPQGYELARKVLPGCEDCNRLNTTLYALNRCKIVFLHACLLLKIAPISLRFDLKRCWDVDDIPTNKLLRCETSLAFGPR